MLCYVPEAGQEEEFIFFVLHHNHNLHKRFMVSYTHYMN